MKTTNLAHIQFEVSDVDGVLLRFEQYKDGKLGYFQLCAETNAEAVCNHIPTLPFDEAVKMGIESYQKYSSGITGYLPTAEKAGFDPDKFASRLGREFHYLLLENLLVRDPGFFDPNEELVKSIEDLQDGRKGGALASHSCRDNWMAPAFNLNGLGESFETRLGFSQLVLPKHDCAKFIERMSEQTGIPIANMAFIEDTLRNLVKAKTEHPDVTTIFISDTPLKPDEPGYQYVDMQVTHVEDFYRKWARDLDGPQPEKAELIA